MPSSSYPAPEKNYQSTTVQGLLHNLRQIAQVELVDTSLSTEQQAQSVFTANYILVAHNTLPDPVFYYGNQAALDLFEMSWDEFTALPSRLSAEPGLQADRQRALREVETSGFTRNYSGIRISKSGRRFRIKEVLLWNIYDEEGLRIGQAALFEHVEYI